MLRSFLLQSSPRGSMWTRYASKTPRSKEEVKVVHRVHAPEGIAHNALEKPYGLNRSPSVQEVALTLGGQKIIGAVETETSNFELTFTGSNSSDKFDMVNHAGTGSVVTRDGIAIEALPNGLLLKQPGRTGYLMRWPTRWPTAAEILLPTRILHPHFQLLNLPCGYVRDFGIAMKGYLFPKTNEEWHAHESEVTFIKTNGAAVHQVFGRADIAPGVVDKGDLGVSQILQKAGEVLETSPGSLHRSLAVNGVDCYKLMYHQGVNGATLPEAAPSWMPELNEHESFVECVTHHAGSGWRPFVLGDTLGSAAVKNLLPMARNDVIGAGTSEILKRSVNVGTIFRTSHSAKAFSKPMTVHGEYMLTVTNGKLDVKVRGVIMNTVLNNRNIKLPTTIYASNLLSASYHDGWTTVSLEQGETILLHEGAEYSAKGAIEGTVSVTNYLMADPTQRGNEKTTTSIVRG